MKNLAKFLRDFEIKWKSARRTKAGYRVAFALLVAVLILPSLFISTRPARAGAGRINSDGTMDFEVNFRFPPTTQQVEDLKEAIRQANDLICDATDGQIRFGDVRITAGAVREDKADIWVMAEQGRSVVSFYPDGSSLGRDGNHIILYQGGINGDVIAHELGHHAFGLGDEYDEQRRFGGACGIGPGFEPGTIDERNNTIMQGGDMTVRATELSVAANHDPVRGDDVLCPMPRAANNLMVGARLDPAAAITAFDSTNFTTARNTSALSGDVEVIDSLGGLPAHTLKLYFVRTGMRAWTLHFGIDDGDISGGTAGNLRILGMVNLTFNANGSLATIIPATPSLAINSLANGAANIALGLNLGMINGFDGLFEGLGGSGFTRLDSNGFPKCMDADCAKNWNSVTNRFETTQQSLMHGGKSDWEALKGNYSFVTLPGGDGRPVAAQPADCRNTLNFIVEVEGTDQVMLFIDRSGSMTARVEPGSTSTRMDFAKAAARAFVDLQAGRGALVGMVSFEESPRLERKLLNLAVPDAGPFKMKIDGLVAGGATGIGTALDSSLLVFQDPDLPAPTRTRTAFLLSDGENNRGVNPREAADRLNAIGVRVFTIPVGNAADRDLLSDIAGSSGGVMFNAPTGNELPPIYAELFARFRGETVALPRTLSAVRRNIVIGINPAEPRSRQQTLPESEEFPIPVEGGAQQLNVFLSARNLDVTTWDPGFRLIGPGGETITQSSRGIASDRYYRLIRVNAPTPGVWRLQIFATTPVDQLSFVLAHVENPAPDLLVDARPRVVTPSQTVSVSAAASFVADLEGPIDFTGTVRRPDGSSVPLSFTRDPLTRTVTASFNGYAGRGIYDVNVQAVAATGAQVQVGEPIFTGPPRPNIEVKPFTRAARTSFFLNTTAQPPCAGSDCDGDGVPNGVEGTADPDRDKLPNDRDDDSDGDDVPDEVEGTRDSDGDGVRDFEDPDSDNDGIPDGSDPNRTQPNPPTSDCLQCIPGVGGQLFSRGKDVTVTIRAASALFSSSIFLRPSTGPDIPIGTNMQTNKAVTISAASVPIGTELRLGIAVSPGGETFFIGPASRNSDLLAHARVECLSSGTARVSFEDAPGGGDGDFNDAVVEVTCARKCDTICFRSPQYHLLNLDSLPPGVGIMIGGVNFNAPTRNLTAIRLALRGGPTLLQQLNRQHVAAQLNFIAAGGHSSPVAFNARWSSLGCYGLGLQPVTLSNGAVLTADTMLKDLLMQAEIAARGGGAPNKDRDKDLFVLKTLLSQLNGTNPLGQCNTPNPLFSTVCLECSEGTACANSEGGYVSTGGGATAGGTISTHTGAGKSTLSLPNGCMLTAETKANGTAIVEANGCVGCKRISF
ncbi:MAG: VWA domain-containing protein [Blastocatellales bacterium]